MSIKFRDLIPGSFVVLGISLIAGLAGPASHAGDPVVLMPVEDRDVPEGSQIPDRRIYETEVKVKAYKEKMRERSAQGLEGLPQTDSPKPNGEQ